MHHLLSLLLRRLLTLFYILSFCCSYIATTSAALPIPPDVPSISGTKSGNYIELRWSMACDVTSVNMQESLTGSSWSTVYTGLGNADDGSMLMATMSTATPQPETTELDNNHSQISSLGMSAQPIPSLAIGGVVCPGWTASRYISLSNKNQSGYYYRINACNSSACSAYSPSILVGTPSVPTTPTTPTSISAPATNATGAFSVSWSSVSGAARYELQQRVNSGAWVAKYSGTVTNFALSGLASGTYQYQVRACSTACSAWKLSSNTQVTLPVLGGDWKNLSRVTVADAGGSDIEPAETVDLSAAAVKGQAGVSGGQASYHIPIDLPPGRNGVQPSVSLSYNSQSGNGVLGVGWSLNAGSSISRCGATFAQDGFTRAVTFNASTDRLCLDGQRLIAINGTYGTGNTEYRTEMDSFVKVVQHGNINDSNSSFTVYKPNGNSATYGANANSRFMPSGLSTVLSWKVTQESYSNGANTIDYQYDTDVAGEHLLQNIYYTGTSNQVGDRRVTFAYEVRPDRSVSYLAGRKIVTERRLKNIISYKNEQPILKYELEHFVSQTTHRSLVSNIRHAAYSDSQWQWTKETHFDWSDSQVIGPPEQINIGGAPKYQNVTELINILPQGDIDGDGNRDWIGFNANAEQQLVGTNGMTSNFSCHYNYLIANQECIEIDVDQDGISDAHRIYNGKLQFNYSHDNSSAFIDTNLSLTLKDPLINQP